MRKQCNLISSPHPIHILGERQDGLCKHVSERPDFLSDISYLLCTFYGNSMYLHECKNILECTHTSHPDVRMVGVLNSIKFIIILSMSRRYLIKLSHFETYTGHSNVHHTCL